MEHIPNMPVGLTMVSSPKMVLQVPAINSKAFESLGVMGAGSRETPRGISRVMCFSDLVKFDDESANAEIVKSSFLARGVRVLTM